MCESAVYVKSGDGEELVMENVAAITPIAGGKFLLRGLLGESREVAGELVDINLMAHKIIIASKAG